MKTTKHPLRIYKTPSRSKLQDIAKALVRGLGGYLGWHNRLCWAWGNQKKTSSTCSLTIKGFFLSFVFFTHLLSLFKSFCYWKQKLLKANTCPQLISTCPQVFSARKRVLSPSICGIPPKSRPERKLVWFFGFWGVRTWVCTQTALFRKLVCQAVGALRGQPTVFTFFAHFPPWFPRVSGRYFWCIWNSCWSTQVQVQQWSKAKDWASLANTIDERLTPSSDGECWLASSLALCCYFYLMFADALFRVCFPCLFLVSPKSLWDLSWTKQETCKRLLVGGWRQFAQDAVGVSVYALDF
jgi:hypothetical protein